jgi:hypothetical protein
LAEFLLQFLKKVNVAERFVLVFIEAFIEAATEAFLELRSSFFLETQLKLLHYKIAVLK